MVEGFRDFLSTWADYRLKVDESRELDGERVLGLYHATSGRAKASGVDVRWMQTNGATLLHIRDGKVTRLVIYPYADRAFSDLGTRRRTIRLERHGAVIVGALLVITPGDLVLEGAEPTTAMPAGRTI
jgi:hypothetical protein